MLKLIIAEKTKADVKSQRVKLFLAVHMLEDISTFSLE